MGVADSCVRVLDRRACGYYALLPKEVPQCSLFCMDTFIEESPRRDCVCHYAEWVVQHHLAAD